ncbi:MAG TPA: copper amine oxidase N-terminal domain-containing protein [Caldisericia bacterium]|nr:copper amine oxidase N-terminal domain-containing protein [Caldisericia bacterium]
MGCLNFKKTKTFLSLTFILIIILLISSNQIFIKAQTNQTFNLSAKGYCGFVYLEWDKVEGADRYWIYRGIGEGNEESMPLTDFPIKENFYKDTKNLIEGKKYCYIVKAVDVNAKEFAKSNEACATPTCSSEIPQEECKLILQFQIGNTYYWVNGVQKGPMLTAPVLRWDRTFLIIRHVVEEVDGEIFWDGVNQLVTIVTKEGKKIEFQIGNKMYKTNGVSKQIDPYNPNVVPFIQNGRTLIPLRVTGDELNAKEINWYGDKNIAELIFTVPCPEKLKGRIDVLLPENCTNGTYIDIVDMNKKPISVIKDQKGGLYSTDCTLPCSGSYIVTPINPNCKFTPSYQQVDLKDCCPAYQRVEFKCECEEIKNGRIVVKMPQECIKGTKVVIYDAFGAVWDGTVNSEGVFDTGCTLKCPGEYTVVPMNTHLEFIPEKQSVTLKECCPSVQVVEFQCRELTHFVQKICACLVRMTEKPDSNGNYQVYIKLNCKEGEPTYDLELNFPQSLLDVINSYTILDYYNKFPHPLPAGLGCTGIVYEPATKNVLEWAAFPDKKPCCEQIPTQGGKIYVKMSKECIEGTIVTVYDETGGVAWSGKANEEGAFDTGCTLKCPGVYKVVPENEKCNFSPVSHVVKVDCCPSQTFVEFTCDCVVQSKGRIIVEMPEVCLEGTIVYIFTEDKVEVWQGKVNEQGIFDTGCILQCPGKYIIQPKNEKCTFTQIYQVVELDNCCHEFKKIGFECNCEAKKGRIVVSMPKECSEGTIIHIIDSTTNKEVWYGKANSDGVFDTECNLACPGIYIIRPENKTCTFSPAEQKIQMQSCCPEVYNIDFKCICQQQKGRLQIKIPRECVPNSLAYIYNSSGKLVMTLWPNSEGWFDSGCELPCPGVYTIKPYNPNCKFYPETQIVEVKNCCVPGTTPFIYTVEFKCECTYKGRIDVKLPTNCLPAKVEIYDSKGNLLYRLSDDGNGYFTTGCTIPCPGTYTIKPVGSNCTFKPESKVLNLVQCCPNGYGYVEFECSCIQMGRIIVNITGNCPTDTKVEIYNMNNVLVTTLTRTAQGNYDSYCTIPCNQTYRVKPVNPKCKFDSAYKDVRLPCCPQVLNVEFKCSCLNTTNGSNNLISLIKNIFLKVINIFTG